MKESDEAYTDKFINLIKNFDVVYLNKKSRAKREKIN